MDNTYDWKTAALHDYQHSGLSLQEIADKYARSRITVSKLVSRSGLQKVTPLKNTGGRMRFDEQSPLSPLHRAIGVELGNHRTMTARENVTDYSSRLMTNRYRLGRMELGLHDYTLSELCRIAQVLGITPAALVQMKQEVKYKPD